MKKKIIYIFSVVIIVFSSLNFSLADDFEEDDIIENDFDSVIQTASTYEEEITINSRIAIAYDRNSKKVIWGKDENKRTAMASTTKIMTAIIVVEKSNLDDVIEVSAKAAATGGSRLGLKKGDKITMRDLLYGLMLRSGNDAAIAIAEHISGGVDGFANLMNQKAETLKLKDTHFSSPHGLDKPDHYTTAYELAQIADYALNNESIAKIVATKEYTITINGYPKHLVNTNELLGNLKGVNGVKTGFTNNAGRCLVTSVNREDFNIITIVIQADTKKDRTKDSIKIIEYIYENYQQVNIKDIVNDKFYEWCNINKGRININKAKNDNVNLKYSSLNNDVIIVKKKDVDKINVNVDILYSFEAPIESSTVIGKLRVVIGNELIDSEDVYIEKDIEKKDIIDYIFQCIKTYKF